MAEEFFDEGECKKRRIPVQVFVHDPEYQKHDEFVEIAKEVCRDCSFQLECFMYGMQNFEQGIWGGAWLAELPPEE